MRVFFPLQNPHYLQTLGCVRMYGCERRCTNGSDKNAQRTFSVPCVRLTSCILLGRLNFSVKSKLCVCDLHVVCLFACICVLVRNAHLLCVCVCVLCSW